MERISLFVVLLFLLSSCGNNPKEEKREEKETLVMYEFSEMALLMEKMFVENEQLKKKIESGEDVGDFNREYLKIHTAVLTDPNDRNETFDSFSTAFIINQEGVFSARNTLEAKSNFNKMVQTCIACHETTCTGPIPRIKKLLIK